MDGIAGVRRAGVESLIGRLTAALAVVVCLQGAAAAQSSPSTGAVTGSVISQNSILMEGVEVVLEGVGRVSTDSQGRFVFSRVSPGNYRLNVTRSGFPSASRAVTVRAGATERLDVMLAGFVEPPTGGGVRVAVPLIRYGNVFLVRAQLNGRREAVFYLDTGASYTTISTAVARELGISFGSGSPTVTVRTASDTIRVPVASLESLQVGGLEARDVQVVILDLPQAGQVVGLLGNTFLSRFQVQLDPAQGVLMLGQ
jgi:clan AA aspartic protease (TIGR02281 family)